MKATAEEKTAQEQLRARMRNPRQGWETAQRNLTWGEQNARKSGAADRVREQQRKWNQKDGK